MKLRFLSPEDYREAFIEIEPEIRKRLAERGDNGLGIALALVDRDQVIHFEARLDHNIWRGIKDYDKLANAKASLSAREEMDTGKIMEEHPIVLQPGDVRWKGGHYRYGLADGVSGLDPDGDEEMAVEYMDALERLAMRNFKAWIKENPGKHFV